MNITLFVRDKLVAGLNNQVWSWGARSGRPPGGTNGAERRGFAVRRTSAAALLLASMALAAPSNAENVVSKKLTDDYVAGFVEYVSSNHQSPEDYVARKFQDHDIVFIGETHHIKQNLEFLHNLIPRLHRSGVTNLGWEFALYADQARIDGLLTADEYDEELARELNFHRYANGYQEYADVFKAAWMVNRGLPEGAKPFRVVALNLDDGTRVVPEGVSGAEMNRIRDDFMGGHRRDMINRAWADVVVKEVLSKSEKAAVYAGAGHTSTSFRFDRGPLTKNFTSMGNFIYNYIRDRACQVVLHNALTTVPETEGDLVLSAVEQLMQAVPAKYRRAGLDTKGTPLGELPVPGAKGYYMGRADNFTLGDLFDGYLFVAPRSDFEPDTPY